MKNKKLFLALIPARKGSFGIKNKNIIFLKKKKLIEHTIHCSIKSKLVDKIYISSNDQRVLNLSKKYKSIKFFKRSDTLSTSVSLMKDVILDIICELEKNYDLKNINIVILQPTSPLREAKDIDNAIRMYLSSKKSSLLSVSEPICHPQEIIYEKQNKILPLLKNTIQQNRQGFKKFYFINGSIYIINAEQFKKSPKILNKNSAIFKMEKKTFY